MDWISVEDDLPEKKAMVLVHEQGCDTPFIGFKMQDGWRLNQEFFDVLGDGELCDCIDQGNITHWMPVPPLS
jgi:hypothetical protein